MGSTSPSTGSDWAFSRALNGRLLELSSEQGHGGLKMSFATVMAYADFPATNTRISRR
ncbi:hypothetical protein AB5I41_14345 [Sphingomonas sp. MMS24-JH45]